MKYQRPADAMARRRRAKTTGYSKATGGPVATYPAALASAWQNLGGAETTEPMSPDSIETRVGRLETSVAKLEQRVETHETDIRAFGPLVQSHAVLQERIGRMGQDINGLAENQRAIVERLDAEARERQSERELQRQRDEEREDRERRDRFVRLTTLVTLLLVFVSTTAAVIALAVQ